MSGWIGSSKDVDRVLFEAGADRDEEGRFLIYVEPVVQGLDGDLVIPAGTEYSVNGKRANLARLLCGTSCGVPVHVL